MDSKQLEKRKKVLLDLMNDKIYVPMKIKELAIILQVSKEERPDRNRTGSQDCAEI